MCYLQLCGRVLIIQWHEIGFKILSYTLITMQDREMKL